jgi:hypothetical protein
MSNETVDKVQAVAVAAIIAIPFVALVTVFVLAYTKLLS